MNKFLEWESAIDVLKRRVKAAQNHVDEVTKLIETNESERVALNSELEKLSKALSKYEQAVEFLELNQERFNDEA